MVSREGRKCLHSLENVKERGHVSEDDLTTCHPRPCPDTAPAPPEGVHLPSSLRVKEVTLRRKENTVPTIGTNKTKDRVTEIRLRSLPGPSWVLLFPLHLLLLLTCGTCGTCEVDALCVAGVTTSDPSLNLTSRGPGPPPAPKELACAVALALSHSGPLHGFESGRLTGESLLLLRVLGVSSACTDRASPDLMHPCGAGRLGRPLTPRVMR